MPSHGMNPRVFRGLGYAVLWTLVVAAFIAGALL